MWDLRHSVQPACNPNDKQLVQPDVRPDAKPKLAGKLEGVGLRFEGGMVVLEKPEVKEARNYYVPGKHYEPGERVWIKKGKREYEMVVPDLDADGNPM